MKAMKVRKFRAAVWGVVLLTMLTVRTEVVEGKRTPPCIESVRSSILLFQHGRRRNR